MRLKLKQPQPPSVGRGHPSPHPHPDQTRQECLATGLQNEGVSWFHR